MKTTLNSIYLLNKILFKISSPGHKIKTLFIIIFSIFTSLLQYFNIIFTAFTFSFITSLAYSGEDSIVLDLFFLNKIEFNSAEFGNIIIVWIFSSFITYISIIFSSYLLYKLSYSFGKRLSKEILNTALISNSIFYENISSKTLFNLLTAENTMLIKGSIFSLITLPMQLSTIIALITIIIKYSFSAFLVLPFIAIIYFSTSSLVFKSVSKMSTQIFDLRSIQTDILSRIIENYLDVKFPPSDTAYKKLFNNNTNKLRNIESFIATIPKTLKSLLEFILILMIGIYIFYSIKIINLPIEIFISSSAAVILSLLKLTPILSGISSNFLSFNSQYESIKNYYNIIFKNNKYSLFSTHFNYAEVIKDKKYQLIIKDLESKRIFKYSKNNPLSLTLNKKKLLWITGKSGCGKSTFLSMVAGIRPIKNGQIKLFIGNDLNKNKPFSEYMHKHIAYMPQNPIFHSITILDYIIDGSLNININEIKRITEELRITDSFDMKPEKLLELIIGPRGYTPSGGQSKLLAFARALYKKNVSLYLLDEPTSDLNEELKKHVLRVIFELAKEKFVICITHDLNAIRKNDQRLRL